MAEEKPRMPKAVSPRQLKVKDAKGNTHTVSRKYFEKNQDRLTEV